MSTNSIYGFFYRFCYATTCGKHHAWPEELFALTNGKLERFHGVLDQKCAQFHDGVDTIVKWHNEIKPHMSLNWKD